MGWRECGGWNNSFFFFFWEKPTHEIFRIYAHKYKELDPTVQGGCTRTLETLLSIEANLWETWVPSGYVLGRTFLLYHFPSQLLALCPGNNVRKGLSMLNSVVQRHQMGISCWCMGSLWVCARGIMARLLSHPGWSLWWAGGFVCHMWNFLCFQTSCGDVKQV